LKMEFERGGCEKDRGVAPPASGVSTKSFKICTVDFGGEGSGRRNFSRRLATGRMKHGRKQKLGMIEKRETRRPWAAMIDPGSSDAMVPKGGQGSHWSAGKKIGSGYV